MNLHDHPSTLLACVEIAAGAYFAAAITISENPFLSVDGIEDIGEEIPNCLPSMVDN